MTWDLNLGADQVQILDSARSMLGTHYPPARKRHGVDKLDEIAAFGLLGLGLPDQSGESGFSVVEEALLHVLLGRHAVSTGALAGAIAARLAARAGPNGLAAALAAGEILVCAGVRSGDSLLLIDGRDAGMALDFGDGGLALIALDGSEGQDVAALGHGTALRRVSGIRAGPLAVSTDRDLLDIADLLTSAQMLGVAEACLDLAVSYAKVREQFGQPIGGFQAIKHHCANMAVVAGMASAQLDMAAIAVRDGTADASFNVAALRRLAERAAFYNTRTAVQVHGGIGFSAEADVHHYLKQAHVLSRLGDRVDMISMPAPLAPHMPIAEGA